MLGLSVLRSDNTRGEGPDVSMLKIIMIVLVVVAVITGGILIFWGKSEMGGVLFLAGCIVAGFLLPPTGHDSTGRGRRWRSADDRPSASCCARAAELAHAGSGGAA